MGAERARRSLVAVVEPLLLIAIVAVGVLGVVRPVVGPAGFGLVGGSVFGVFPTVEATLDLEQVRVETDPVLPSLSDGVVNPGDAVVATIPTRTTVAVYDPSLRQSLGLVGSEVARGLLAIVVLLVLFLLARSLRQGDPFTPVNARRLYAIAAAVGLGGQAAVFLQAWGRDAVISSSTLAPYVIHDVTVSFVPLIAGLGIAVAAEVFRQGAALRADVEGLV